MKSMLGITAALACLAFAYLRVPDALRSIDPPSQPEYAAGISRSIFAAGVVEGSHRERELGFELQGRIASISVVEGQSVRTGDVLAALDDALIRQQFAEAEAQLHLAMAERDRLINGTRRETLDIARASVARARVAIEQATSSLDRAERLYEQRAFPAQELQVYRYEYAAAVARFDEASAQLEELQAPARPDEVAIANVRVRLAEAAVRRAEITLDRCRLRAPHDGVVLRIASEPGELASPEHPRSVLTMANLDELRVRAFVEELDALSIAPGQCVTVRADGRPHAPFSGVIIWMAPVLAPKSRRHDRPDEHFDVDVREILIALDDPRDLVVGLPVEVFIDPAAHSQPAEPVALQQAPIAAARGRDSEQHSPSGYFDAHPVQVPNQSAQ